MRYGRFMSFTFQSPASKQVASIRQLLRLSYLSSKSSWRSSSGAGMRRHSHFVSFAFQSRPADKPHISGSSFVVSFPQVIHSWPTLSGAGMRRYGHFVSFTFQFRLEQFLGLTLNGGSLQSPQFRVGAHEFDVKISRCSRANDSGTYAMFIGWDPLTLILHFLSDVKVTFLPEPLKMVSRGLLCPIRALPRTNTVVLWSAIGVCKSCM